MQKLVRAPKDWLAAWQAQADEDGHELTEWIRRQCNKGLSKKRREKLSEPIQRGRPKKPEE